MGGEKEMETNTEKEIETERESGGGCVVWNQTLSRVVTIICCFLLCCAMGIVYSFGNINPYITSYLRNRTGTGEVDYTDTLWISMTQNVVTNFLMTFVGFLSHRLHLKIYLAIGIICHAGSLFGTYWSIQQSFPLVVLTYGVLGGVPNAIVYPAALKISVGWFPGHTGLVAGAVLMGYGFGGMVWNEVTTWYINPHNLPTDSTVGEDVYYTQSEVLDRVPDCFVLLGTVIFALQFVCTVLLCVPPNVRYEERIKPGPGDAKRRTAARQVDAKRRGRAGPVDTETSFINQTPPHYKSLSHSRVPAVSSHTSNTPQLLSYGARDIDNDIDTKHSAMIVEYEPERTTTQDVQTEMPTRDDSEGLVQADGASSIVVLKNESDTRAAEDRFALSTDRTDGEEVRRAVSEGFTSGTLAQHGDTSSVTNQHTNTSGTVSQYGRTSYVTPHHGGVSGVATQHGHTSGKTTHDDSFRPGTQKEESAKGGSQTTGVSNREGEGDAAPTRSDGSAGPDYSPRQVVQSRVFWTVSVMLAVSNISTSFVTSLFKAYGQTFISDDHFLTLVASLSSVCNAVGRPLWGLLADRIGYRLVSLFTQTLLAALVATFMTTEFTGQIVYSVWVCAMYFTMTGFFTMIPSLVYATFGPRYFIVNIGVTDSFGIISSLTSALIAPQLKATWGWHGMFYVGFCGLFIGILLNMSFSIRCGNSIPDHMSSALSLPPRTPRKNRE